MTPIVATRQVEEAELRLEWLLRKLHQYSLGRRSKMKTPILVGGTALRRAYGLTRPSLDLDFAVEDSREMRQVLNAVAKIANSRWPGARAKLRQDGEEGWRVEDGDGRAMLHVGGLIMAPQSLELAHWVQETWTLPIARLAAMKVRVGVHLRSKARDLYDMGFIAEQYPGDITVGMAWDIRQAGLEGSEPNSRWTPDYRQDRTLHAQELTEIGRDVAQAAGAAIVHLEGALRRRWANQSVAAAGLQEAVERDPQGTWSAQATGGPIRCTWTGVDGRLVWSEVVENQARIGAMIRQANVEAHPQLRGEVEKSDTSTHPNAR